MSIAVIIPVFNAASYIRQCLHSCIDQKELDEIIIVNDGCNDHSMSIVDDLVKLDERIVVVEHENAENRGRSASRNLGINRAQSEWITFCDADDFYLENRFKAFVEANKNGVDGFYEDVKSLYENNAERNIPEITGIPDQIPQDQLKDYLITTRNHSISIIGLILRKRILTEAFRFDETLWTGEDTDLIWRLAGNVKLKKIVKTESDIVRRVHGKNTYSNAVDQFENRFIFYKKWKDEIELHELSKPAKKRILDSFHYYQMMNSRKSKSINTRLYSTMRYLLYRISGK